jgi:hypothetical protein
MAKTRTFTLQRHLTKAESSKGYGQNKDLHLTKTQSPKGYGQNKKLSPDRDTKSEGLWPRQEINNKEIKHRKLFRQSPKG